ncbi:MAG: flagellar hook-associated protein FlgL [Pseudomonadota bacterium]
MRISSAQIHRQATEQLQQLGAQAAQTQQQIASGKRLVAPGDDPVGAARLISINQELSERAQYLVNTDNADVQLGLTDTVLNEVVEVVQRVQELTLQAGSGVQSQDDRALIAVELEARLEELIGLANSANASGQYLFSGFDGETPPFEQRDGVIEFTGDNGRRLSQIDRGQFVATNVSGQDVFVDLPSQFTNVLVQDESADSSALRELTIVDQDALDGFFPEKLVIQFNDPAEAGGQTNYTVRRGSDLRVVEGLENVVFSGPSPIVASGISFRIDGSPQSGDSFTIASTKQQSLFDTVAEVTTGLKEIDPANNPEEFELLIERTIDGLNAASESLLGARADVGSRFNTLAAVSDLHEDIRLQLQEVRSGIEDLDFAEAVSNLAFESFLLEAAQQSFVRINQLSLFNRL